MSAAVIDIPIVTQSTTPYEGQKPGTSGLRKAVKVFQQENYTENFVQSILGSQGDAVVGRTLVVGGDGRFFCEEAASIIVRMCAANKVGKLIVGQKGLLSTPCVSLLIRASGAAGGIVLTASHNPGGPDKDFGIKFNIANGGPAPDAVTDAIFAATTTLSQYKTCPDLQCDLDTIGTTHYQVSGAPFAVEVVDPVSAYVAYMKEIFDFGLIKRFLAERQFTLRIDAMHGVTGPYVESIFVSELGVPPSSCVNTRVLPDFGGKHPDPNLTYAADLVRAMEGGGIDMGAAFDGDGDRNMILGRDAFFVSPSDSVAVIADNARFIPYFQKNPLKGLARSMPTGCALDKVAAKKGLPLFEVPTGWKYFGSLMDAGRLSLCGEESFGTGSDHVREKDGIWAALAWLSVLAGRGPQGGGVREVLMDHWAAYGRNFFTRYDYENCASAPCQEMMSLLEGLSADASFAGSTLSHAASGKTYVVAKVDNFSYTDPIDGSVATKQGVRVLLSDGSRFVFRLSGTGSSGATVRLYVEAFEQGAADVVGADAQLVLLPLVQIALQLSQLEKFTGRQKPTVIT